MLSLWRPTHPIRHTGILFDPLTNRDSAAWLPQERTMAVDVEQRDDRFIVRADLPGVDDDDVKVEVKDNVLHLCGSREDEREEERDGLVYRERRSGSFSRRFRLGPEIDVDHIEARFRDGVLELTLPRTDAPEPRQIPVNPS